MKGAPSPGGFRVGLISMPWAIFNRPSIQLGALKAWLDQDATIATGTFHPYLQAARAIGTETYHAISRNSWAGESLYSPLLFPEQKPQAAQLFNASCRKDPQIRKLKQKPDYDTLVTLLDQALDQWIATLDLDIYDLVGFSICFNQLLASLTAAARIKALRPDLFIVAGGSSCVGKIGDSLLRHFPQIDAIISGEGEQALRKLCHHLHQPGDLSELPPQVVLRTGYGSGTPKAGINDLNTLPVPDYTPYFEQMRQIFTGQDFNPLLPIEFSRGCWWNRCAFCNLNLQWQGYRWKESQRVTAEVTELSRRYGCIDFTFTDNALPPREADLFFQTMAEQKTDYDFFAEIRVITDENRLIAYRHGGLSSIQAGIEALSSSLLARMKKGTTAMENIAAMKASRACQIRLEGNLIIEFPGSTEEEVAETLRNLDFVLPYTPLSAASFFLGHGSPVCNTPKDFGVTAIFQHQKNALLFPQAILRDMTMLINDYRGNRSEQRRIWQSVARKIRQWQKFHHGRDIHAIPTLSFRDGGTFLIIRQEQLQGPRLHHRLKGTSREIYLFCQQIRSLTELCQQFPTVQEHNLRQFLTGLIDKHLLFQEGEDFLALAIQVSSR